MKIDNGEWFLVISLVLLLAIAVWYAQVAEARRRHTIVQFTVLAQAWAKHEENENKNAESEDSSSMTYPVRVAKASVYRGCIVDLQRVLHQVITRDT